VKHKLRSQLDAALSGDAMAASGLRRLSLAASTPGSGSKSMRKCQSARGPGGASLPWRSAQKEAQVGAWSSDDADDGGALCCAAPHCAGAQSLQLSPPVSAASLHLHDCCNCTCT
jgi:hypothetical protein